MSGQENQNIFKPTLGKLFFLCGFSVLLSSFGPMSIFAPAPLALCFLIYGPKKSFKVGLGFFAALLVMTYFSNVTAINAVVFAFSLVYSTVIYLLVKTKTHPSIGILKSGTALIIFLSLIYFAFNLLTSFSLEGQIELGVNTVLEQLKNNKDYALLMSQSGEEARAFQDFVKNPNQAISEMIAFLPATIFVSLFFSLWATMFVIMRNSVVWKKFTDYPWSFHDFLQFKTPDFFVWPLIGALIFAVGGDYLFGENFQVLGYNALYCLGVFYFFQGFGVFLEGLSFFKVYGFFRLFIIISMLLFAWKIIMLVGLFDNWVNFRKFFQNKKEGDIL